MTDALEGRSLRTWPADEKRRVAADWGEPEWSAYFKGYFETQAGLKLERLEQRRRRRAELRRRAGRWFGRC